MRDWLKNELYSGVMVFARPWLYYLLFWWSVVSLGFFKFTGVAA